MLLGVALVFLVFLFLGAPIGFILGIARLYALLSLDMPIYLNMAPQRFFAGLDMFTLMAMPCFIHHG